MKLFISWRSASYFDLDGEFCIAVKQVLNWLCIAVSFVIHISHRLTLLLHRSKYELYTYCTGLQKVLHGFTFFIMTAEAACGIGTLTSCSTGINF